MNRALTANAPGRPQSEELNRAILAATIEVLAEVGLDALSVAEVARRAHSTPPAIYRRFAGKEDLVIAALRQEVSLIEFDVPDQGGLRADLVAWVQIFAQSLTPVRLRVIAALYLAASRDPGPARSLGAYIQAIGATWREILCRAQKRGELGALDDAHDLIAQVAPSLITNAALTFRPHMDAAALERLVDAVLMPALRALPPSSRGDVVQFKET